MCNESHYDCTVLVGQIKAGAGHRNYQKPVVNYYRYMQLSELAGHSFVYTAMATEIRLKASAMIGLLGLMVFVLGGKF